MEPTEIELLARVLLAAVLGAALGVERESQQKPAGLRTHTLVAAGATLFTVAGMYAVSGTIGDPTRIAAQVVTGIGFIGAGGMIRTGFTMTGITTAATLWFAAAIGVTVGFGLYVLATASLVIALVMMLGFAPIRHRIWRNATQQLEIRYHPGHGTLTPLFETLNAVGAQIYRMSMTEADGLRLLRCEITGIGEDYMSEIVSSLRGRDEVIHVGSSFDQNN
jgi:putative Mg2+ transporter-C (MgtC) family protein